MVILREKGGNSDIEMNRYIQYFIDQEDDIIQKFQKMNLQYLIPFERVLCPFLFQYYILK